MFFATHTLGLGKLWHIKAVRVDCKDHESSGVTDPARHLAVDFRICYRLGGPRMLRSAAKPTLVLLQWMYMLSMLWA